MTVGTLHLVCGKIAAGKSTLCARLAPAPGTVLISQDFWLKRLFGDELVEVADYLRVSPKLRAAMGPHVADLLRAGVDAVLDSYRDTLEDLGGGRGVTDPVSGPVVLEMK